MLQDPDRVVDLIYAGDRHQWHGPLHSLEVSHGCGLQGGGQHLGGIPATIANMITWSVVQLGILLQEQMHGRVQLVWAEDVFADCIV